VRFIRALARFPEWREAALLRHYRQGCNVRPRLNFEIEDQEVLDQSKRLRFEPFMLRVDNIGVTGRNVAKRHDEAVCQTLVPGFRAAIRAGHIIINARDRFGQIQKILEELADLFLGRSIFKLQQDNVFYL
jgi:hypothetical protein